MTLELVEPHVRWLGGLVAYTMLAVLIYCKRVPKWIQRLPRRKIYGQ